MAIETAALPRQNRLLSLPLSLFITPFTLSLLCLLLRLSSSCSSSSSPLNPPRSITFLLLVSTLIYFIVFLYYPNKVYLLAGLAITFAVEPLVENRAFQYAIASFAGVSFFLSLALLLIYLCFSHLLKVIYPLLLDIRFRFRGCGESCLVVLSS
jgi:hypothetical protein